MRRRESDGTSGVAASPEVKLPWESGAKPLASCRSAAARAEKPSADEAQARLDTAVDTYCDAGLGDMVELCQSWRRAASMNSERSQGSETDCVCQERIGSGFNSGLQVVLQRRNR